MVARKKDLGVFASALLALVALTFVACGESTRAHGPRANGSGGANGSSGSPGSGGSGGSSGSPGSGGSGGSSGSAGGSQGGSNDSGGATSGGAAGSSAATAGSGGDAGMAGAGGTGDAVGGGAGVEEKSATFHWIEATEEHRARAASANQPAVLRTYTVWPYDAPVLFGTSQLIIGDGLKEIYTEGFVWTEGTGTTALGRLPGATPTSFSTLSYPTAISADGSVVVGSAMNAEGGFVPFRWTRADGIEAIGEEGGGVAASAVAVSADGSVVLGSRGQEVFRWTRALGAVTIVEPFDGDDAVSPLELSADGTTVLGRSYRSDNTAERLFVWTEDSGTRAVENLPGFVWCPVMTTRISRSKGLVAGGACRDGTQIQPFLWAGQDRLAALGPTDALGGKTPFDLVAVTADGAVAVGNTFDVGTEGRAYRWTEANGWELIELPQGYTSSGLDSSPEVMSEDGSVVVGSLGGITSHAFLWSERAGAIVLSPLEGHDTSIGRFVSADGSVATGTSSLGTEDSAAVYWRADGVPHRLADELAAGGVDLGGGAISPWAMPTALGFLGSGSKDEVSDSLFWRAQLP
jgi:uncharacterized membrane protein